MNFNKIKIRESNNEGLNKSQLQIFQEDRNFNDGLKTQQPSSVANKIINTQKSIYLGLKDNIPELNSLQSNSAENLRSLVDEQQSQ